MSGRPAQAAPLTLADQLRGWPDERLSRLLARRPDLAAPAPRDSAQLAARAVVRTSVLRALESLDRLDLTVLEAVATIGPCPAATVREVLNASPSSVAGALDRLGDLALVWGSGDSIRATTAVGELLGVPPGPQARLVPQLVDELDERARALLEHLDRTGIDGTSDRARSGLSVAQAHTPTEHLLARRLLVARDERYLTLPWSVRLTLRGGVSTHEPVDVPPGLALTERDQSLVDRTAAGAAFETVRRTELLLERWSTHPPGALRAGGLGVRETRAAADFLHLQPEEVTLVVEVAAAAGLIAVGSTDELDAAWLPTDAFDAWLSRATAERWTHLAHAWLLSTRLLSLVGGRVGNTPINVLSPGVERPWLPARRREVLAELAATADGRVLAAGTGAASLLEVLRWRRPRLAVAQLDVLTDVLEEATSLGVLGLGGASTFGRALLAEDDPTAVLAPLLPQPVDHLLVQADLTAIAPGPLTQELARDVALLADVESRGGATVYRFSATSVRRAFDSGWSAGEIHAFLASVSRTPVPQALGYLVDDVSRRFGTVRAGHAEAFLRSDDETALTELLHLPAAISLRLRRIAPTVVVSDVPLGTLLPKLRELGVAPVVEAPDGTVRVARPDHYRARTPRAGSSPVLEPDRMIARAAAQASAVVAAVRAGDRVAAERPSRGPATTPADVVTVLRGAIESGSSVLIGFLDNHGTASERLVRPLGVEAGQLTAYDGRTDRTMTFPVHRITRAATVD